jgi:hypothetical protein
VQLETALRELIEKGSAVLAPSAAKAPSTEDTEELLQRCILLANDLVVAQDKSPHERTWRSQSAASALLDLDKMQQGRGAHRGVGGGRGYEPLSSSSPSPPPPPASPFPSARLAGALSNFAHEVAEHPHVFLSPAFLHSYVTLQALLRRPQSLPDVLRLYATKPIPLAGSTTTTTAAQSVKYKTPNPRRAQFAVPEPVAAAALDCAISARDLDAALGVVAAAYAAPAFRRAKLIRKALLPATAAALVPFAAWAVAAQVSAQQLAGNGYLTAGPAFAGILAYVGFTGTLGFVALTTANDQMDRVTWAIGTPLRERWLREEERAAADRVAGAWGFKNPLRHGEEEGAEWERLREWIGRRGMVLDKVSLMPGME